MTPQRIRQLREALGDTQAAFARRLRVAKSTVHYWETGAHPPNGPTVLYLEAMAKKYLRNSDNSAKLGLIR
jgi:DNA-binding transcriptional regulator YiaG